MRKNKTYQLLSSLSNKELVEFKLFLNSPYFNQSPTMVILFNYIRPFHPLFKHEDLEKERIYKAVKPNEEFSKKFVIDRMSDLNKLLEKFLAVQEVYRNPEKRDKAFRSSLYNHHLHKRFIKLTTKKLDKIRLTPRMDWNYFSELWSLEHEIFTHPHTMKFVNTDIEAVDLMNHLDEAFIILNLRYGLHHLIRQQIFKELNTMPLFTSIIKTHRKHKNPIIQLYLKLIHFFQSQQKEKVWEDAFNMFTINSEKIPTDEKREIITALINLGYSIALSQRPDFFNRLFELYEIGIDEDVWIQYGTISERTFRNIVTIGASIKKFDWTENFIEEFKQYIPETKKEKVLNYSNAYLLLYKGDYEEAKKLLAKPQSLSLEDKITFKSLYCRCEYENRCHSKNNYKKSLNSFLTNFSKFLQRRNLSDKRKKSYNNFIGFIRILNEEKDNLRITKKRKIKLRKKLDSYTGVVAKNWLSSKIEEL